MSSALPQMGERDLVRLFIEQVPYALPEARVFQREILNVETAQGWRARAGVAGQADCYALVKGGRHIEIEAKAVKHKWYARQLAWRQFCQEWGIPYLVLKANTGESPTQTVERWIALLRSLCT